MNLFYQHLETPIGLMEICASDSAVCSIHFVDKAEPKRPNAVAERARSQLQEYFAGERKSFDLDIFADGTAFQRQVWQALTSIGFGETCSYSDIARLIGNPKAVRAVGAANGKNPMTIVVPCHRIIGANGTLTGYASGVERKAWLLNHESSMLF